MKAILLIDFGSTYTKLTAVDVESETILGTAASFTTVQTDINDGLTAAQALLEQKTADGYFTAYTKRYIPVLVKDNGYSSGDIVKIKLTGINGGKMDCEIIE